jgi:hypothetical protein
MTTMASQRLLIVLTAINLVLLVFLLAHTRMQIGAGGVRVWTNMQESVIRGRALEIVDDEGRVRASIMVHPGDPAAAPSGGTAILRLIDENGRPSVKLSTTQQGGGGLTLVSESQGTYIQLTGRGLAVTKDGQLIP